jgi:hypothetical protein
VGGKGKLSPWQKADKSYQPTAHSHKQQPKEKNLTNSEEKNITNPISPQATTAKKSNKSHGFTPNLAKKFDKSYDSHPKSNGQKYKLIYRQPEAPLLLPKSLQVQFFSQIFSN